MALWFWEETEQPFIVVCWQNGQLIAALYGKDSSRQ